MTGPSKSVDGLTQLKPGRVAAVVGVSVVVGDGDAVSDGVGDAFPIVVGVVPDK